ncbi:hypothetical protein L6164_022768 [Bauhinia variegata]|uniref:Uncharacterized protein n=1 Tax=Bauhinia variegata TaxID=167791 RepID=A0ACB9MGR4_BAUVA|nr:hypothetical protein L6164_022768 [Bauhinia variegata]
MPDELKVDIAAMYLEGDALDLFSWISGERTLLYWEELVKLLQEHYGPAEFQNPDEHLCSIRQTGSVQEYRQEFAKRVTRVKNWPEHCLLVNTQNTTLPPPLRLQASSHANSPGMGQTWEVEKQARRDKGLCFRCNEKFSPGHRCKQSGLAIMELADDEEKTEEDDEPVSAAPMGNLAEISFHAILGRTSSITMKLQGTILGKKDALQQDPYTKDIMADLSTDSNSHPNFHVANNRLYYKNRLVVLNLPSLKEKLLAESHDTLTAGHGGTSQFKLVYGREPPTIQPYVQGETYLAELEEQLLTRDEMLQPYRQHSLAKRRYEKLSPRFFGPYKIIKQIGPVAYELKLPESAQILPVFHVSLLRPVHGQHSPSIPPHLPINSEWELTLSPSKILCHRWIKDGGKTALELVVQWDDRPLEEASWENYELLKGQFPDFHLEDKVSFPGGSDDTVPPLLTYSRRQKRGKPGEMEG